LVQQTQKQQKQNGSQSVKADREVLSVEQQERRFRDALEDDEVREVLKFLYARDKARAGENQWEFADRSITILSSSASSRSAIGREYPFVLTSRRPTIDGILREDATFL